MKKYTVYHLFDYDTGLYVGPEFTCPKEFMEYHFATHMGQYAWWFSRALESNLWGDKIPFVPNLYHHSYPVRPLLYGRYTIKDEYGVNFRNPWDVYYAAVDAGFGGPRKRRSWEEENIPIAPKHNINKLKCKDEWDFHRRNVQTQNERRQNDSHMLDYGRGIVRATRRYLPDMWWDEPRCGAYNTRKSWKHNSKRPHQWLQK